MKRASQIDLDGARPYLERLFEQRTFGAMTGKIDGDMDRSEGITRSGYEARNCGRVRHIAPLCDDRRTQRACLLGHTFKLLHFLAGADREIRTLSSKRERCTPTHVAAGPGDNDRPPFQFCIHVLPNSLPGGVETAERHSKLRSKNSA